MEINGSISAQECITCGVLQGSILGPILLVLQLPMYDIYIYNMTNTEIAKLNDWFCANKLSLYANKTKYITFRPNLVHPDIQDRNITINGHMVDRIGNNQPDK